MGNNVAGVYLACLAIVSSSCADRWTPRGSFRTENFPLSCTEPETRPPMQIDGALPFRLEFGRGSGQRGLDIVKLDEAGQVILYRRQTRTEGQSIEVYGETCRLHLDTNAIRRIARQIQRGHLLDMPRAFHADVCDGTQWVFWVVQGEQAKSIYFNNHFPPAIRKFAAALDKELRRAGLGERPWTPISEDRYLKYQKTLWNSLDEPAPTP